MTGLEFAANVVTALSVLLAGRNSVHTWWSGIIGCILFALLFYQVKLYADVALQGFFVVTSVLGWYQWLHGRDGRERVITQTAWTVLVAMLITGMVVTFIYGYVLHHYTDAYAPFIDSAVLAFSVLAQLLLMQRRVETWLFWLIVNSIAIPLYASRELYFTAALYSVYWVNAVVAWYGWRRQMSAVHAAIPEDA